MYPLSPWLQPFSHSLAPAGDEVGLRVCSLSCDATQITPTQFTCAHFPCTSGLSRGAETSLLWAHVCTTTHTSHRTQQPHSWVLRAASPSQHTLPSSGPAESHSPRADTGMHTASSERCWQPCLQWLQTSVFQLTQQQCENFIYNDIVDATGTTGQLCKHDC